MIVETPGSWVSLCTVENAGAYRVDPKHWDEITAAYSHWYERRIDRVLNLTTVSGSEIAIAASRVADACYSTPETRERDRELDAAIKAEQGFDTDGSP